MAHQTYLFILILILFLALLYLGLKRHQHKKPVDTTKPKSFHGITIKTDDRACHAVKQLAGKRFLASEAPNLPLSDCKAKQCFCQYMHHPDRRLFKDRRQMLVYNNEKQNTKEQRYRKERRTTHVNKDSR